MAFTVIASWDFRGAGSEATKLASRIGSYTLTKNGSPVVDSSGITCDNSGENLRVTLDSALKLNRPFWQKCYFRSVGDAENFTTIFGLTYDTSVSSPYSCGLVQARNPGTTWNIQTNDGTNVTESTASSSLVPTVNTDVIYTLRHSSTQLQLFKGSGTVLETLSAAANPAYSATSTLSFGPASGSGSPLCRYGWYMIGSGALSDAESDAIDASPTTYLYPSSSTSLSPWMLG